MQTGCQGSEEEVKAPDGDDCFLEIPICAPDHPILTRGDVGKIASSEAERKVYSLQIWVFKNNDGSLLCYRDLDFSPLNVSPYQQTYKMKVDKTFAEVRDKVDIYVVANAESCNLSFGKQTDRDALDQAVIGTAYFGTIDLYGKTDLTDLETGRIARYGLPMSAVLKKQSIYGSFPSLRIGSQDQPAVLQLTRAVSKLRFVLCRIKEKSTSTSTSTKQLESISISLKGNQIPVQTYIIPRESYSFNYSHGVIDFGSVTRQQIEATPSAIPEVENPLDYVYETQNAQNYENLINTAISSNKLAEFGLTYFRESDKKLEGTITYKINDNGTVKDADPASFTMAAPGDFLRNHSWIVYVYFMDSKIHVLTVTHIGIKDWVDAGPNDNVEEYNW